MDCGDYVIVINAAKVNLTGNKLAQKTYNYHTGYPGGLRQINYATMMQKTERVIELAVKHVAKINYAKCSRSESIRRCRS